MTSEAVGEVRRVAAAGCALGEGPVWRPEFGALWFVDIIGRTVLSWSPERGLRRADAGRRVGAIAPRAGGGLWAASERGIGGLEVDFEAGRAAWTAIRAEGVGPEGSGFEGLAPEGALMNDAAADPAGRIVFGSKALDEETRLGDCWRWDGAAQTATPLIEKSFVVFNGPAFSPSGDRIYFADSPSQKIQTASYDAATGAMGRPEVFAELAEGYPDGMACDAEGGLWNAQWDGWRVVRYRPDGSVDRVIETPVSRPTSVAFGGADMKTLFVTSAKRGRDDAEDAAEAGAGDLYAIDVAVPGAPVPLAL